jgi:hypothetical protein
MAKDARTVAEKWARKLAGATEDIRAGIEAVTEAPSQKAIQKKEKMKQRIIQAIDSGKWERGLSKVTLEEWKDAFINKGLTRIGTGAEQGRRKMEDFMAQLIPYVENLKAQVNRMPDTTLEQRIQKMISWVQGMAKFQRR